MNQPVTCKHALLLFAKPPIPGLVKTRLTFDKGGQFSEGRAAQFFTYSMMDVTELACLALWDLEKMGESARNQDPSLPAHNYDLVISTSSEEDVELMRGLFARCGQWPREFRFIVDKGANFNERFDDAFKQVFALGYDSVVAIGADMPMLPREHISRAFRWLQYFLSTERKVGVVEAPCHECGVSLIGWTRYTPLSHLDVYYASNGRPALDTYVSQAAVEDIPFAHLDPVADVDDIPDLAHCLSLIRAANYASNHLQGGIFVPRRVLAWADALDLQVITSQDSSLDSREHLKVSPEAASEEGERTLAVPDLASFGTVDLQAADEPDLPDWI